jgi:hypothetical protein
MKGIVFNLLEKMVTERFGIEAWEGLLERATLKTPNGAFLGSQTYPDEDLMSLVASASEATKIPAEQLVQAFGLFMFPHLAALAPSFLEGHKRAKDFLLSVDRVIHVEVRKLHPGSVLPRFTCEDPAPDRLVMIYQSRRNLCDLAIGLIEGAGKHFGERIGIEQTKCVKRGDANCHLSLTFSAAARA